MNRLMMVKTDDWNADEWGNEWDIFYSLIEDLDEDGQKMFAICDDDGKGNGDYICHGYDEYDMRRLMSKLGAEVEPKNYPYRREGEGRRMGHDE